MPMTEYINGYRDFGRVRGYCRECDRYGNCWACPPYDFDETALPDRFTDISLLATVITPSEGVLLPPETADRFIRFERQRLDCLLLRMERDAEVPGRTARAFFAGTCLLCPPEQCTRREGRPCRHPESIRPSLEALGFDIARTAADIFNTPLQWSRNGQIPHPHQCPRQKILSISQKQFVDLHSNSTGLWQTGPSNSSFRTTASIRPRPASSYSRNSRSSPTLSP